MCRCCYCFLFLCLPFVATFNPNQVGPFNSLVRYVEECSDTGSGDIRVSARIKKLNRTVVAADFNVTLAVRYDDTVSIHFSMAQFTNGGFKENFFTQTIPKACSTIMYMVPEMWTEVLGAMHAFTCPIKKGFYYAKDFTSREYMRNITMFYYNKYKTTLAFKKQGKLLGCFHVYVDFVPKRKHLHGS